MKMADTREALKGVKLAPKSTVLVVVDMENEFCKPSGSCYIGPPVSQVISNLAALGKRCRGSGVPVIYVRSVRFPEDLDFTRFGRDLYLIEGTDGPVIVPELAPKPGEPIVEKHTHDCFYNTTMDGVLKEKGITSATHKVIVTGVMSNVCVYHAVLGFHVRHYYTIVPLDCMIGAPWAEELLINQFTSRAYKYNVTLTTSDRIVFQS
jgi:nicotinamidase-related amidase